MHVTATSRLGAASWAGVVELVDEGLQLVAEAQEGALAAGRGSITVSSSNTRLRVEARRSTSQLLGPGATSAPMSVPDGKDSRWCPKFVSLLR